ncbi:MAG: PD-(D/E)XK nuclease family protein [Bacteroidales bacterium]|nr:PD-(D/E)XK nuclease family protein [Bacteroidales bacterium]
MEKFLLFFHDANIVIQEYNNHRDKQLSSGKLFNIFNITELSSNECKLHSALIAELLYPKGSHGCGSQFLDIFLQILDIGGLDTNVEKVEVHTEKVVQDGRIDIEISDGKYAIIIEVKIYADDMDGQLFRYYNYAKNKYGNNFKLYYLTLLGDQATEKSLRIKDKSISHGHYSCISFAVNILQWIDKCMVIAGDKPLVLNILTSYKQTLQKLTGKDMDKEYKDRLLKLMIDKDNAESVAEMINLQNEWFSSIIEKYVFGRLEKYVINKGLEFEFMDMPEESGCWIYKTNWHHYGIFLGTFKRTWRDIHIGITWHNKPQKRNKTMYKKDYHTLSCFRELACRDYPLGYSNLRDEYRNWNYNTITDMLNGNLYKYLIEDCLEPLLTELETEKIELK